MPVNSAGIIESLAEKYGAEVEYTPINPQVAINKYYQNNKDIKTEETHTK